MKRSSLQALSAAISLCALGAQASGQDSTIHVRYGNESSVKALIHDVERESNSFRAEFERRYAKRFVPNWREADGSRKRIQDLDKALEVVQRRIDHREKPRYLRDDVAKVVQRARAVDFMFRAPDEILSPMSSGWDDLKRDIDTLAEVYDLSTTAPRRQR